MSPLIKRQPHQVVSSLGKPLEAPFDRGAFAPDPISIRVPIFVRYSGPEGSDLG